MKSSLSIAAALATVAVLVFGTVASAAAERPIKGWYQVGVVPVAQRCGANALTIGFEGSGIVSHLGRITGTGSNCTEFSLTVESVPIYDGLATFVSADGSSITATYAGTQAQPVAGTAATESTFTVLSGTGRFADAQGTWSSTGEIDFILGLFEGTLEGWLSY